MAMRSSPMPKAKPEYFWLSMPHISSTLGFTMPQPSTSTQPVSLQMRQPLPWQAEQVRSTSALGSVKGKKLGRKRVETSLP